VRPGRAADHSPPFSAAVMEEYIYTYTHPLGHTGQVTGSLYLSNVSVKWLTLLHLIWGIHRVRILSRILCTLTDDLPGIRLLQTLY